MICLGMFIGYIHMLHNCILGTWEYLNFDICEGSWHWFPTETEEWLCLTSLKFTFTVIKWEGCLSSTLSEEEMLCFLQNIWDSAQHADAGTFPFKWGWNQFHHVRNSVECLHLLCTQKVWAIRFPQAFFRQTEGLVPWCSLVVVRAEGREAQLLFQLFLCCTLIHDFYVCLSHRSSGPLFSFPLKTTMKPEQEISVK